MIKFLHSKDLAWRLSWRWRWKFKQETGRPPTRKEWWDHEFARRVVGWTDAHRATTSALRSSLYEAGVTVKSGDAAWTVDELAVIERVVASIAMAFGGPASRIGGAWSSAGPAPANSLWVLPGSAASAGRA